MEKTTAPSSTTKKCPYCAEEIKEEAIKCRFCSANLSKEEIALKKAKNTTFAFVNFIFWLLVTGFFAMLLIGSAIPLILLMMG